MLTDTHTAPPKTQYIHPDELEARLKSFGPSVAITKGHFELDTPCEIRDLDWNHMDQHHRPHMHNTYHEALRLVTEPNFGFTLTTVRLWGIPFLLQVTDIRLRPRNFYQVFSLFSLIHVHIVIYSLPGKTNDPYRTFRSIDWYIVSHPFFKFLHRFVDKRLTRLNEIQNEEDLVIQERRTELRKKGYSFLTDNSDFINSGDLANHTHPPVLPGKHTIALGSLSPNRLEKFSVGPIDLLVRRDAEGFMVWPSACPHEGGPLEKGKDCGRELECPWHGLKFPGTLLSAARPKALMGNLALALEKDTLYVTERNA